MDKQIKEKKKWKVKIAQNQANVDVRTEKIECVDVRLKNADRNLYVELVSDSNTIKKMVLRFHSNGILADGRTDGW